MATSIRITTKFDFTDRVVPNARKGAAEALNDAVMATITYATPITPHGKTGWLKGKKTIKNASAGNLTASVTWDMYYAIYQERGTRRGVRARKFAETGSKRATPMLIAEMKAVGAKLIR